MIPKVHNITYLGGLYQLKSLCYALEGPADIKIRCTDLRYAQTTYHYRYLLNLLTQVHTQANSSYMLR
jgi:hypothetical protein